MCSLPKKASFTKRTASVVIFDLLANLGYFSSTSCGVISSSLFIGGAVIFFKLVDSTGAVFLYLMLPMVDDVLVLLVELLMIVWLLIILWMLML